MKTAAEIADWLVRYRAQDVGAPIDAMSLEKYLYYAQGFYLALTGTPLFRDDLRAWRDGPVVQTVWTRYRNHRGRPINVSRAKPPSIPKQTELFLCGLMLFLSSHTAIQLSQATHSEDPWLEARRKFSRHEPSDVVMPKEKLQAYFASLIAEGEEMLSRSALLADLPEPCWGWLYVAGIRARHMTAHPFFIIGSSMWNARLREPASRPRKYSASLYRPPTKEEAADRLKFSSVQELRHALTEN
jgi:uncharacterized phage-associated protein